MDEDEKQPEEEEDEFDRRFRELEEKAAQIRAKTTTPEPPAINFPRAMSAPQNKPEPRRFNTETNTRGFGIAFAIGYSFVGPLLAGIIVGTIIDGRAGGPATMVGILVGTVLAFVLLIRLVNKLNQQ